MPHQYTWQQWSLRCTTGSTGSTSIPMCDDSINVWYDWNLEWNASGTTGSSIITDGAWTNWVIQDVPGHGDPWADHASEWIIAPAVAPSDEDLERAAERARQLQEQYAAEQAERRRVAAEATERAKALLEDVLTEEQRAEFRRDRFFTVESQTSKRRYRVHAGKGRYGNIEEVDEVGVPVGRLCCAPVGNIPEGDYLLGQKLHLEHNEEEFRRTANITNLRRTG